MPGITKKEANKLGGGGGAKPPHPHPTPNPPPPPPRGRRPPPPPPNHPSLHQTGTKMEKMTSGHK